MATWKNLEIDVVIDTANTEKALEKLRLAMEAVSKTEIVISVVPKSNLINTKKWWKFLVMLNKF